MKPAKFKMTELGPIPSDWEVKRLGEVWKSFRTGPFGSTLHSNDYVENGIPIVNPMHIDNGRIIPTTEMCVSHSTAKRLSAYRLSVDDIVIGRRGEMGRSALITTNEKGWICGTGCFFFHLKDNVCSDYVARYLRTPECATRLEEEAVGTTLINLNQTILGNVLLPLPPLPEQRRIAAALSDVDELIGALGKLVEKKRAIKTGAMQRLLTGQTRLPGFGGKWEEKRLGDVLKIGNGRDYKHLAEGNVPVFGTGGLMTYVNEYLYDGATVCIGRKGTIDEPQYHEGKIWTVDTLFYTYDFDGIEPKFLYYLSKRIDWLSYNTATGVPSLTSVAILGITVALPPLSEQRAIAGVLSDMDAEIAALEAELAKYTRIKSGMMQELLTGRTRLRETSSED